MNKIDPGGNKSSTPEDDDESEKRRKEREDAAQQVRTAQEVDLRGIANDYLWREATIAAKATEEVGRIGAEEGGPILIGSVPIVGGLYGACNATTWGGAAVEIGLEFTGPLGDAVKGGARPIKSVAKAADIPIVVDRRLSNVVDHLYKGVTNPNRFGDGTTMDVMKYELATGDKVFGRDYVQKGQDSLRALQHWSANPPGGALASDMFVAEDLIGQLRGILGYK